MTEVASYGLTYVYNKLFKYDNNFAIEKGKKEEEETYLKFKSLDRDDDGKLTLEECLLSLEKSGSEIRYISRAEKHLVKFLSKSPSLDKKNLIDQYGFNIFVSLSEKVKSYVELEILMKNLLAVSDLIQSKSDLLFVARRIRSFIDKLKKKHKWCLIGYLDLGIIKGAIKSKEDIRPRLKEYYMIIKDLYDLYCWSPSDEGDLDSLKALKPLFDRYGLTPFATIAKAGGISALFQFNTEELRSLAEKYGIDVFVKIAKLARDETQSIYMGLDNPEILILANKYGMEPFVSIIKEGGKYSFDDFYSLFNEGLPIAKDLIHSKEDLEKIGKELIKYSKGCSKSKDAYQLSSFFRTILMLQNLIHSWEDLSYVMERVKALSKEFNGDYDLLQKLIDRKSIKSKEDLKKNAISILEQAAKTSKSEHVIFKLAELYFEKKDKNSAHRILKGLYRRATLVREMSSTYEDEELPYLKFKVAMQIINTMIEIRKTDFIFECPDDKNFKFYKTNLPWLSADIFEQILIGFPYSPVAQRALLLKRALRDKTFSLGLVTTFNNKQITIKTFKGIKGLSLIYLGKSSVPEVIPGDAQVDKSGSKIVVKKYLGKFRVIFKKPTLTLPRNNDALLKAYRILPNEFFEGFKRMVFTGADREFAGSYGENDVKVHQSSDPYETIVHELAHHWDLRMAIGYCGRNLEHGDLSRIYYDISWTPDKIKKEIWGGDYKKVEMDRSDFDKEDFAREYGLCNRREDFATMVDNYVTDGQDLRGRVVAQAKKANFELLTKYLFIKYLTPFRGREYGLDYGRYDPIDFRSFYDKFSSYGSKDSKEFKRIKDLIDKMVERNRENKYQ